MATKMREYWWDEIAMETVEVTDPAQLDGGDWTPTGRQIGGAVEWTSERDHLGLLIHAYSLDEADAAIRLFFASTDHE